MGAVVMSVIKTLSAFVNIAVLMICLPRRRSVLFTVLAWATVCGVVFVFERMSGELDRIRLINALIFFPLSFYIFKAPVFQILFATVIPVFFTLSQQLFVEIILRFILTYGTTLYWMTYLILVLLLTAGFILLVKLYGKRLLEKMFAQGRMWEWALYAFSAIFSLTILMLLRNVLMETHTGIFLAALFFLAWTYAILCFAVINTHEKTKQKYEADIAREIVSSGRDYYDKLTEITEYLHILRHDYKLHLTSMQKLLDDGYSSDAREYLTKLNEKTLDTAIHNYCDNRVLNALLYSFAERCEKEKISFTVKIILPPAQTIDDYELCVITGNLLENAITACLRTLEGRRRYIELSMRPREGQYGIKVENSYDGVLRHEGKELFSTKKDGGMGISSIKSVANRHNGEYAPFWDAEKFSAFVVLRLEKE